MVKTVLKSSWFLKSLYECANEMRAGTFLQPTNDSPTLNLSIGVKIVEIEATISVGLFVSVSSSLALPIYSDQTDTTSEIDESGLVYN